MPGDCCTPDYDLHFDDESARKDLLVYRADGPDGSTRRLLDVLIGEGIEDASLLDIGGGIGIVQLELLAAGASRSLDVDASQAYLSVAETEAAERGYADRTAYRHGDFVTLADEVPPADVVTLDRVICCYPDVRSLVSRSAAHALRLYGLVYPVDRWYTRGIARVMNLLDGLRRSDYRMQIHSQALVDRLVREAGFEQRYYHAGKFWQTVVYARVGVSA